jgi:hypothetical protein
MSICRYVFMCLCVCVYIYIYIYVCMCVCIYIYMYIYWTHAHDTIDSSIHTNIYICARIYIRRGRGWCGCAYQSRNDRCRYAGMYLYTYVFVCIYTHTFCSHTSHFTFIHACKRMNTHTYICTQLCTYAPTCTHTHTHTHMHTHMHTYTYTHRQSTGSPQ